MCFLNCQFLFAISNFYIGQNECLPIVSYSICVSRIGCPYLEIIFVRCPHKHKCCFIGKAFFVSSLDFRSTAQECHLRVCAVITDTWDWTTHKDHNYSGCWVHLVRCEKRRQKAKWQETKLVSSSPFIKWTSPLLGAELLSLCPQVLSSWAPPLPEFRACRVSLGTSHQASLGKKAPKCAVRETLKPKQTLLIS